MKSFILALALSACCASALATNYVRIPIPGIHGSAGTTHPGLPTPPGGGNSSGLVLSTASLTFDDVVVGSSSEPRIVTVKNSGRSVASLSVVVSGVFAKALGSTCGSTLAAGAQCDVGLVFQPAAVGKGQSGSLTIESSTEEKSVALTGSAKLASYAQISIAPLYMSNTLVVGQLATYPLLVTNVGNAPVTFGTITTSASYSEEFTARVDEAGACRGVVAAGATCQITLGFSPTTAEIQARRVWVYIPNNGTDKYGQPAAQSTVADFDGRVVAEAGLIEDIGGWREPVDLSFQKGSHDVGRILEFKNVGNVDVHISNIYSNHWGLSLRHNCSAVAPNEKCSIFYDIAQLPAGVTEATVYVVNDGLNDSAKAHLRFTITP